MYGKLLSALCEHLCTEANTTCMGREVTCRGGQNRVGMELLTITAAARYLSVSRTSIYNLIDRGTLSVVRPLPDTPRIKRSDLDALIAATTTTVATITSPT